MVTALQFQVGFGLTTLGLSLIDTNIDTHSSMTIAKPQRMVVFVSHVGAFLVINGLGPARMGLVDHLGNWISPGLIFEHDWTHKEAAGGAQANTEF